MVSILSNVTVVVIVNEEESAESGCLYGLAYSSPAAADEVRSLPNHSNATAATPEAGKKHHTALAKEVAAGEVDNAAEESGPTAGPTTAPRSCSSVGIDPDGPTCPKKTWNYSI